MSVPPSSDPAAGDPSVAAAVVRLSAEFPVPTTTTIAPLVRACRRDLAGSPPGALPELVERLARQRLLDRLRPG